MIARFALGTFGFENSNPSPLGGSQRLLCVARIARLFSKSSGPFHEDILAYAGNLIVLLAKPADTRRLRSVGVILRFEEPFLSRNDSVEKEVHHLVRLFL
jgi:hypothetical protein